ncbi:hypothetical protein [Mycobacterium marinum]|uniref:hypothetical protein n=1 Tax=Mycobacterium marinum TaxID=1781 RepID=UPI00235A1353|nr:hypothetical protein [Mycobacterium marinum]MDC9007678.1 hypothetical protein [Mycobacterium marinum]
MDLQIVRWIREFDENGAVSLARTLCFAEVGWRGFPIGLVSISGRVKVADGGIDGRTNFPPSAESLFPPGDQVWQIKSGGTSPSATVELNSDKHAALIEAIKNGADYVLFWTNDPIPATRSTVITNFTNVVKEVRADAKVTFLFADEIEQLCYQHPTVLAQHGPVPISGLVGIGVWAPPEFRQIEFQADESRRETIDLLRQHVAQVAEPSEIDLYGDTGVGKSRLVYEALSVDGVRERVLVASDPTVLDPNLLANIASTRGSSLILVVDDCDAEDRRMLTKRVGMTRGRVRLITLGPRVTRDRLGQDRRRREVPRLEIQASKQIALSRGLDDQQAALVASLTEGYPGLAASLAKAIEYGEQGATLLSQIRGDYEIGPVLATLLNDNEVPLLGLIAIFERIGFDGDLAPELTGACEVFGIDETAVRVVADRELQRFVSTAGRFRRVTPKLFAVWLASRFLEIRAGTITEELKRLPESLRDRIIEQMRQFGGDPVVSRILDMLLNQSPFNSGAIAGVDSGAARLIYVASIVNPPAAITAIEKIMQGATTENLVLARAGRRDLVAAIEVLLWSEDLFERAATAALRLAIAENEQWSNNATGTIQGIYRVFLGGTAVSYQRRIAWTREALGAFGEDATRVIVPGLASAFDAHESRMSTDFGGGSAPTEWRPATREEEIETRSLAWQLLMEIAQRDATARAIVASSLAQGLRVALLRGSSTEVLTSLETLEWPARGRAELIESLNHARKYDEHEVTLDAQIADTIERLAGRGLDERAKYVFAASVWELTEEHDELIAGLPGPLVEVVEQVADGGEAEWLRMIEISRDGNQDTASRFFEQLAKKAPDPNFECTMEQMESPPLPALIGYLRGLVMVGAVDPVAVLSQWTTKEQLSSSIVRAVHTLPATDELARLAATAVRDGLSPAEDLGLFLYGGWARNLDPDVLASLLTLLAGAARRRLDVGDERTAWRALEHAFGIADQWTEGHQLPAVGAPLRTAISELLATSERTDVGAAGSSMLDLHVAHIIPRMGLGTSERLGLLLRRLQSLESYPSKYVLKELDELTNADPSAVAAAIVAFLVSGGEGAFRPWPMWLEDSKLLSRIQVGVGLDQLVQLVVGTGDTQTWARLIAHVALDTDEPDPLLVALLSRSDDAELRATAMFRFLHPRSVTWGSESENLRRRREVAERWRTKSGRPALFNDWLDELLVALDAEIRLAEEREAEGRR